MMKMAITTDGEIQLHVDSIRFCYEALIFTHFWYIDLPSSGDPLTNISRRIKLH